MALSLNERVNLYSSGSTRQFYDRHIRHSLTLATRSFDPGSVVADWGTGGGMPGLVLAIVFPDCTFHLIDAVGKKIHAVRTMARRLGLHNVETHHTRAEEFSVPISHSVSRATAPLSTLWSWHKRVIRPSTAHLSEETWPQGLICLKGGDLSDEIAELHAQHEGLSTEHVDIPSSVEAAGLEEKSIVLVTATDDLKINA